MDSYERVLATIQHRQADRMPVYGWTRANLEKPICAAFGSVDAFEDHFEFDLAHLFGGPGPHPAVVVRQDDSNGPSILPEEYLDVPLNDPNDQNTYQDLIKDLSLIHISEPTRLGMISYAVFCL